MNLSEITFRFETNFDIDNDGRSVSTTDFFVTALGREHAFDESLIDANNTFCAIVDSEGIRNNSVAMICAALGDEDQEHLDAISRLFKDAAESHLKKEYPNGAPEWDDLFDHEIPTEDLH